MLRVSMVKKWQIGVLEAAEIYQQNNIVVALCFHRPFAFRHGRVQGSLLDGPT